MSLGSRISSRGQAAARVSLASTPREPLFFLYPAWIRKSSTASPGATVTQVDERTKPSDNPFAEFSTSSNSTAGVEHTTHAETLSRLPKDGESDSTTLYSKAGRDGPAPRETLKCIPLNTIRISVKQRRRDQTQEHFALPIENKVRKLLTSAALSEHAEKTRLSARKAYQTYRAEKLRSWLPDWRVVLADLVKHTPQHGKWLEKAIIMTVPQESMKTLFHGLDDNIWDISGRYDCSVGLGPRDTATKSYNTFILSGSANSISRTTADVLRVAPGVKIKGSSKKAPDEGDEKATFVTTIDTNYANRPLEGSPRNVVVDRRALLKIPAHKIPKPSEWDTFSFYDYVCKLTYSEVPSHLHRFMYKKGEDHTTAVVNILRSLFANRQYKLFVSRAACKEAMAYFVKTNRIEDVKVLFVHMEMMNLQMDPEVFNTMLRGAAKANDLHTFHFILHLMLRSGFSPNIETWTAFITTIKHLRIQLYILAGMRDKGLLQHLPATRRACEYLAIPELESSLAVSQSQEDFLAHMDSRYGRDWLSVNTGNRILHTLGVRGLISRCWEFLWVMDSRMLKPDNFSVNTILHHCKQGDNLMGAIEVLKVLPSSSNFLPDEETYRILFEMSWRSRSYNCARVVWRYACLSAATTLRMRTLVFESLKHEALHEQFESPRDWFNKLAGEFIVGCRKVDLQLENLLIEGLPSQPHDPGDITTDATDVSDTVIHPNIVLEPTRTLEDTQSPSPNPVATIEDHEAPDDDLVVPMRAALKHAKLLVNHDYKVFQDWEAVKPFSEMLVEALERDKAWKIDEKSTREKKCLAWMFQHGISVPIRKKWERQRAAG